MKKSSIISFLAVIQLIALVQIIAGSLIVPAIWRSGQSAMETTVRHGGDQAVASLQTWLDGNLRATSLWIIITGLIVLVLAGVATVMIRKKPLSKDNSIQD